MNCGHALTISAYIFRTNPRKCGKTRHVRRKNSLADVPAVKADPANAFNFAAFLPGSPWAEAFDPDAL